MHAYPASLPARLVVKSCCRHAPPLKNARSRDQQYEASRRLLGLAGVRLRQHLFKQPVVLMLTNDAKRPALFVSASSSSVGGGEAAAGGPQEVAPAVAAVLQNGAAAEAQARGASGGTGAAAAAAANGASRGARGGRRGKGRQHGQKQQLESQPPANGTAVL